MIQRTTRCGCGYLNHVVYVCRCDNVGQCNEQLTTEQCDASARTTRDAAGNAVLCCQKCMESLESSTTAAGNKSKDYSQPRNALRLRELNKLMTFSKLI